MSNQQDKGERTAAATRQVCNYIEKETLAQMFSFEYYEITKITFFTEHL